MMPVCRKQKVEERYRFICTQIAHSGHGEERRESWQSNGERLTWPAVSTISVAKVSVLYLMTELNVFSMVG
jgi:hypothetical protein